MISGSAPRRERSYMNAVLVIIWLIAMAIVVMLRRYWMHNNHHIGYLYAAYGLAAVFIAVLVALAPGGAIYAFAVVAAIGLPIGLLVDRRRHLARH
jgi:CDP-diglyceride synthetase